MATERLSCARRAARQRGVTLVELMIAIALSLFMIAALVTLYVNNSAARTELDRASRQIENGRYAMDVLRDNIAVAGYYGEVSPRDVVQFNAPTPCTVTVANMGWSTAATPAPVRIAVAVQGPEGGTDSGTTRAPNGVPAGWGCGTLDQAAGTGFLVVRHLEPARLTTANVVAGTHYVQSTGCLDATRPFVLSTAAADFTLTGSDCTAVAPIREYVTKLFYVQCGSSCQASNNPPPALVMRELRGGSVSTPRVIADGIEDLQFEFGRDTTGDGVVDDYFIWSNSADFWRNVVAVRIRLIARGAEPSPGYEDTKTYERGAYAAGGFGPFTPASGEPRRFKRRSYTALVHMPNVAGPREAP